MSTQDRSAANEREKPRFGVRLDRGIVTYFNDAPLTTWEQADEVRQQIESTTGERGEVEEVWVLG